ncbi:MAG: hypothetical protein K0U41_08915 [Gammaproteobacteria bacterium]|nr:hypothetical protein [Gammaproteobacteria bacterium]
MSTQSPTIDVLIANRKQAADKANEALNGLVQTMIPFISEYREASNKVIAHYEADNKMLKTLLNDIHTIIVAQSQVKKPVITLPAKPAAVKKTIVSTKKAVKSPNNPNTMSNLAASKKVSTTPKVVELHNYLRKYLELNSPLSFTLKQLTFDMNTDLNRTMTPSGVTRALMTMGISLKTEKLTAIEKIARTLPMSSRPLQLNDVLGELASQGYRNVSHTFVGQAIANI